MDRMSVMDAMFLYSEDGNTHNDVGVVLVFDGPSLSIEEVTQLIADRIALVPRFRQKVRHMPFGIGLPVWMDDVGFDLWRHVHHHPAQPALHPIGAAVSRIMSGPMDLTIPLWQIHLVSGLPDDRWVLIVRMHHAMVDGVNSIEIVRLLLSPKKEGEPPIIDNWRPRPEVTDAELVTALASDAAEDAMKAWSALFSGAIQPSKLPETFDPSPFMRPGIPISPWAINGPVRPGRRWGMLPVELETFKKLRARLGGTINDLILTACGYGYSSVIAEYLKEPVQHRTMRVMVPVSLSSERSGPQGNEIGAMVVEVPVGEMPTTERLNRIKAQTEALKQLKSTVPASDINPGTTLTSPATLIAGSRIASTAPTFVNTVITNVPGPQNPLYLSGRKLHWLGACIALWSPLKTAICVHSYDGTATISAVTDEATFSTVTPLLDAIGEGIDDLIRAADDSSASDHRDSHVGRSL